LPWAPAESLDGSTVVGLSKLGSTEGTGIPDVDEVIVSTSGELSAVGAPLKTTDLRGVRDKLSDLVVSNSDIVVVD
jgi:hypothetical protein